jgi:hypothetical protein
MGDVGGNLRCDTSSSLEKERSLEIVIEEFVPFDCEMMGVYVNTDNCCLSDLCVLFSSSSSLKKDGN